MPITKAEPDQKKVAATIKDFDGVVGDLKKLMDKLAQIQKAAARDPQAVVEAMKPLSATIKDLDGQLKDLKTIDKQVDSFASG
jgi:ABC-type transporter Mla subunit MlaD